MFRGCILSHGENRWEVTTEPVDDSTCIGGPPLFHLYKDHQSLFSIPPLKFNIAPEKLPSQ